ncbi:hypothetical protein L9F63_012853 [Diploptera punctata]|uniref:Integrin beta n=1 Tax=Diploptera punctata TaxID=6984 RepID=A0AAD8EMB0_DIPPU|nr:hypothetical protein L9F63_012853 [Diploptera punctata]
MPDQRVRRAVKHSDSCLEDDENTIREFIVSVLSEHESDSNSSSSDECDSSPVSKIMLLQSKPVNSKASDVDLNEQGVSDSGGGVARWNTFETQQCEGKVNIVDECMKPYSYKHHLDLSEDDTRFTSEVKKAPLSKNIDSPEGTFDAIMQAIVCQDKIGWRENARHLLVVSTDASFHYAGDGKVNIRLPIPNDMQCHLDASGKFSHSLKFDYPSVSQINQVAMKHYVHVIFVVQNKLYTVYQHLTSGVYASSVLTLSDDSSNLLQLLTTEYEKITENVVLADSADPNYLTVTYNSTCSGYNSATHNCQVGKHEHVEYTIDIKAERCPENRSEWTQHFEIFNPKLKQRLLVAVNITCECACEVHHCRVHHRRRRVSHSGSYKCGVCDCDPGLHGSKCQCDIKSSAIEEIGCRAANSSSTEPVCSGNGHCECGVCECDNHFSGEFCQCNEHDCPRSGDMICSGHGSCDCGYCKCRTGWTGEDCGCPVSDVTCMSPETGLICSGHGVCECGMCKCHEPYRGDSCSQCFTCQGEKCELYKEYIHHDMFQVECSSEDKCRNPGIIIVPVDHIDVSEQNRESGVEVCQFLDDDDCYFYFRYYNTNNTVHVQRTKVCREGVNLQALILGLIAAIVACGVLLLVAWKVITTIHDRKEFAKFEKERSMAKWDTGENPLYRKATSTFRNPTFHVD